MTMERSTQQSKFLTPVARNQREGMTNDLSNSYKTPLPKNPQHLPKVLHWDQAFNIWTIEGYSQTIESVIKFC
jgi:hypothetical protein